MSHYFYQDINTESCGKDLKSLGNRLEPARDLEACVNIICSISLQRLGQPLTLEEMERVTGYSRRSLTNAFHARFGCSPCKWQQSERLRIAHLYLRREEKRFSTKSLAIDLGFVSASKFCAYYRRMFGKTPKQTFQEQKLIIA